MAAPTITRPRIGSDPQRALNDLSNQFSNAMRDLYIRAAIVDGVAVLDETADVQGRQHRQVDQQDPPGNALAHRECRRQQ